MESSGGSQGCQDCLRLPDTMPWFALTHGWAVFGEESTQLGMCGDSSQGLPLRGRPGSQAACWQPFIGHPLP